MNAAAERQELEPPSGAWWKRFGDAVTERLVEEALRGNTDLRAAAARVMAAKARVDVALGRRLPQVDVAASRDRRRNSFSLPQIGRVGVISTSYDLGFAVSWQADLFGKLAREQQAAWAEMLAAEADREALLHTVIAEVVRIRVAMDTLERRLAIARSNTKNWQSTHETVERRYQRGVASPLDVRLARENLAASRALEPELEYQLSAARHGLDVLLGHQPGRGPAMPAIQSALPPLEPPPVGVPAALLDRRPDLRATEMRAAAATARIGVAMADLFPDLSLSATGGYRADKLHDLIHPESRVYNLLVNLAWRAFAGGSLKAQLDVAKAQAEVAAAEYATAVLRAVREVEDALVRDETARRRYGELGIRLAEAQAAERLAKDRYQRGVTDLITVLETERRRRLAQDDVVLTQQVMWDARITLFLALGGDWEEKTVEVSETEESQGTTGD